MSELQLALIALAVLALLALYLGQKWQERRRLRRLRERLHRGVGDALLQEPGGHAGPGAPARPTAALDSAAGGSAAAAPPGERLEPHLDRRAPVFARPGASLGPDDTSDEQDGGREGAGAAGSDADAVVSEQLVAPALLLRPDWAEDPLLDCSLELRCARAVDGVSVIDAAARLLHASWALPVHFVVWDGRHQQWVLPDRFGYYTDALASIQLANRRHCVDARQIDQFVQAVQELAQVLGADFDPPDAARLVEQAGELDRLCARYDIRIGLTVESAGASWTGPQLRSAAQECGFAATGNQSWVQRLDDDAEAAQALDLYTLQADPGDMRRLVLEYDIARAPVAAQAFAAMVAHARTLAEVLGGRVVDDHGRPIDERSVETVERQLAQVFAEMRAAGIEPGSTRARRLYA